MKIHTFPHEKIPGWSGSPSALDGLIPSVPKTLEEFAQPQGSDSMAVAYSVAGEAQVPRLNKGAVKPLADQGKEPTLEWVFLDIDNPGHAQWSSLGEAEAHLEGLDWDHPVLESAGYYSTRAGYRLFWKLEPPLPVSRANGFLRAWGEKVSKEVGIEVDAASYEWTRFFRLPRAKRDGEVLDSAMDFSVVEEGDVLNPWTTGLVPDTADEGTASVEYGDAPEEPVEVTLEMYGAAYQFPWMQHGRPVPPDAAGSTYTTLRSALARIGEQSGCTDPHVLASYAWASVQATPGRTISELWRLASWVAAQEERNAQKLKSADPRVAPVNLDPPTSEEWAAVDAVFRGRRRQLFNRLRDGQPLTKTKADQLPKLYEAARHIVENSEVPTPEALYRLLYPSVRSMKSPTDEVWSQCIRLFEEKRKAAESPENVARAFCNRHPLTLKVLGTNELYQLDTREQPYIYRPCDQTAMLWAFNRYTRPALPVEVDYQGLQLPDVLDRYGSVVETVEFVSGLTGTRFDVSRKCLESGVHVLAPCKPEFHQDVDDWLRALGSSEQEVFLDWLASVTYTQDQPLAALYLNGPPGLGKSLLLKGISSLWGVAPVSYDTVAANFNAGLLDCPLVAADEGITVSPVQQASASEQFRNLVANTTHATRRKFKSDATLHGALRVIVTANDSDAIPFKKQLGQHGLDAIVQRILYIKTDNSAREFLEALGGRQGVSDWLAPGCRPGRIAEHLLWLRDNREVAPGKRFLVEGKMTQWHQDFALNQGLKPTVMNHVARLIKKKVGGRPDAAGVSVDTEKRACYVQATAIHEALVKGGQGGRNLTVNAVTKALKQLDKKGSARRVYIDGKQVRAWEISLGLLVDQGLLEWEDVIKEGAER